MRFKILSISQIQLWISHHRLLTACVVIAVLLTCKMISNSNKNKITFETAKAEYVETFTDEVLCVGKPKPLAETYLSVQHGGRLDVINGAAGTPVKAGDIIAIVDRTANAAGLKSALSGYRLAQSEYNRTASLLRSGSSTHQETDSARSNADIKRAELEQAKQRVEDSIVRSPIDGVISVLVFKVGDKVPDGGRVAAVEDPTGTQLSCRIAAEVAAQFPAEQTTTWTLVDHVNPASWTASSKISVEQPQGGFAGLEREVRIETNQTDVRAAAGKTTSVAIKLAARTRVTRLPSLAVVRKQNGTFVLERTGAGDYRWLPIQVIKQSAQETIAQGIPNGSSIMLLKDDIAKIEAYVGSRLAKSDVNKESTVK